MAKSLTPQEKKALSYAKDCRNNYGENDKASRKLIPLRKAWVNRDYRRKINQRLKVAIELGDLEKAEIIESEAKNIPRLDWKKYRDAPLGKIVEDKLDSRITHAGNGKAAYRKRNEFTENLRILARKEEDGRWAARALSPKQIDVRADTREEAISECKYLAGLHYLKAIGAIERFFRGGGYTSIDSN